MRLLLAALLLFSQLVADASDIYQYKIDIDHIEKDRVTVELIVPHLMEEQIVFSFPKVIPGSYSEKNFGDYIDDFTAWDTNGKKLKISKLNPNQYQITNAGKLATISYKVNDTWDKPSPDFIFQPGGSNIEAGENVVMNNHAFFGYIEGHKNIPFEITVTKPAFMYGATHLNVERKSSTQDVLKAPNYFQLVDNPVFYAKPDTTSFTVAGSQINVAVISVSNKVKSKSIAEYLKPMASALNGFFGGLPVDNYQFLFFFDDIQKIGRSKNMGGYGALEHNYSSLYYLPEITIESRLKSLVLEVASHEFLHILTPLNLHSEEIENFDFIKPQMSKHLWLYEGVTEYFSELTQLQYKLITPDEFFKHMREKINDADKYGNFSLTEMSKQVLDAKFKDKYNSVYNKGALTAMMLDLYIRNKTNGKKDLKQVITSLATEYGPGKPFKDDALFDEFVAASDPSVRNFIDSFIIGSNRLPYEKFFSLIGYDYSELKRIDTYYNGKVALRYDQDNDALIFTEVDKKNALEINDGDILISVEDIPVTITNIEDLWDRYFRKNTIYPVVTITVLRNGVKKELFGNLFKAYVEAKNYLEPMNNADANQLKMRDNYYSN